MSKSIDRNMIANILESSDEGEDFSGLSSEEYKPTDGEECTIESSDAEHIDHQDFRKSKPVHKNTMLTDIGEIKIVLGCMIIMSYNRLPSIRHYWSKHYSIGNDAIKSAITRDRFQLLSSKMYFASPEKPEGASKLHYIEDMLAYLKSRFLSSRMESAYQSIDESMTKFKGRFSMKQYLPLKPTKRGIKMWLRCDALTGYTYDFNIYCGKEEGVVEGTLGERVVNKLAATIQETDVTLCFDRFFTSLKI
ncbi:PREDICTED: piggyBac transposable element-derived protein 4-like [Bactrocera latifrons]|uniref:piggyBac transposable element-derived protein 4-like n=1 Tax=Bactrocera latifrons TaxID=174628 RepID=UPI0008DE3F61|nr:PREDICTED: piggyBac transposable element-derived protein 4-like [Bactrocera latifrons]